MKQNPYRKPTPTTLLRTEYTEELRLMEPENKPITHHQRQINKPITDNNQTPNSRTEYSHIETKTDRA